MDAATIQHNPAGAFNLAMFEAADTAVLDVLKANGQPLMYDGKQVQIEMYGPGSEEELKAQTEIDRANSERMMQSLRGKSPVDEVAERRAAQIKKLVAVTKEIRNFPIEGGSAALYANTRLGYITNQAAKFQGDWANFLPASEPT